MVILGLLLVILGGAMILAAVFVSDGSAQLLGMDLTALAIFLVGVAAGAFILWGFAILKYGTRRELRLRRERKQLTELSQKLDQVEGQRRPTDDAG
jgi:membrane protein implicated in regulation of membrane protease activity